MPEKKNTFEECTLLRVDGRYLRFVASWPFEGKSLPMTSFVEQVRPAGQVIGQSRLFPRKSRAPFSSARIFLAGLHVSPTSTALVFHLFLGSALTNPKASFSLLGFSFFFSFRYARPFRILPYSYFGIKDVSTIRNK